VTRISAESGDVVQAPIGPEEQQQEQQLMQQGPPVSPGCSAVSAVGDIGQPSEPISFEPKPLETNVDPDALGQQKVSDPTTLEAGCSGVQCADLPPNVAQEDSVDDGCNNEGYNDDFESDDDKPLLSSDADSDSEEDLDLRTSAGEPEICRRAVARTVLASGTAGLVTAIMCLRRAGAPASPRPDSVSADPGGTPRQIFYRRHRDRKERTIEHQFAVLCTMSMSMVPCLSAIPHWWAVGGAFHAALLQVHPQIILPKLLNCCTPNNGTSRLRER
jgi:hypothetical protein